MADMDHGEPTRSRESFNRVASLYDRYRRGYPAEVLEQLVTVAGIEPDRRVLEIGPGTGQLTRPLLQRGAWVTAVEPGHDLAALAQRNLADYPHFAMVVSSFEDWALPRHPFDTVVSATAFHWIDERIRAVKAAQALTPGGILAAVYPHHVLGDDDGFFQDSQRCYLEWELSSDPHWRPPEEHEIPAVYPDIDQCREFAVVERLRMRKTRRFSRDEYVGLLRTDSLILTLAPANREGFLTDIADLIDSHYGGGVCRTFVYEIVAATRR